MPISTEEEDSYEEEEEERRKEDNDSTFDEISFLREEEVSPDDDENSFFTQEKEINVENRVSDDEKEDEDGYEEEKEDTEKEDNASTINEISSCSENEDGNSFFTLEKEKHDKGDGNSSSSEEESCSSSSRSSSSSTEDDDEDDDAVQEQEICLQLFEGSNLTKDEGVYHVMHLYLKNSMTKKLLSSVLETINKLLPESSCMPRTMHKLLQYVKNQGPNSKVIRHHYCKKCVKYLGVDKTKTCGNCDESYGTGFFFELNLKDQLLHLLQFRGLAGKLQEPSERRDGFICDITDGEEYIRVNKTRRPWDLTLIVNTDGISLRKSAKLHCWPILATIAEVPPQFRNDFVIICGLWCSKEKPKMNTFMKPFCESINKYYLNGIKWVNQQTEELCCSRVLAPIFVADAPARAELQNIMGHQGNFGCNICELKRQKNIPPLGKRATRYFPFEEIKNLKLRRASKMIRQADAAPSSRHKPKHIKGVKGRTILSSLPLIDISKCFVSEIMHSVWLGVFNALFDYWFEKPGRWSLKKNIAEIEERLLNIKPPHTFARKPRSITEFHLYKASEFYNFMMFYALPVLNDIMGEEYYQHLMSLVISVNLLLQEKISPEDLAKASFLLEYFVKNFINLYNELGYTYNLHQMLHLPLCVKRWGPLWAWCAFIFEHSNGVLTSLIHSTNNAGQELMNNLQILQGIQMLKAGLSTINAPREASNRSIVIGKGTKRIFNADEKEIFLSQNMSIDYEKELVYLRASFCGESYTCVEYKENMKTNSYTIEIKMKGGGVFDGIIKFFFIYEHDVCFVMEVLKIDNKRTLFHKDGTIHFNRAIKADHVKPITSSKELKVIKTGDLEYCSHLVRVGDYVCRQPNTLKFVM